MMNETFYTFKVDNQNRILLSMALRDTYQIGDIVFMKLLVIKSEQFLKLSGREFSFYQITAGMDSKGRIFIPKEARTKLDIVPGIILNSYEDEEDEKDRSLLLKVLRKEGQR